MTIISHEQASRDIASGAFLYHHTVLGEVYGVTRAALKQVQAMGGIPVLEVDYVADVAALRATGFDAAYLFIGIDDAGKLYERVHEVSRAQGLCVCARIHLDLITRYRILCTPRFQALCLSCVWTCLRLVTRMLGVLPTGIDMFVTERGGRHMFVPWIGGYQRISGVLEQL